MGNLVTPVAYTEMDEQNRHVMSSAVGKNLEHMTACRQAGTHVHTHTHTHTHKNAHTQARTHQQALDVSCLCLDKDTYADSQCTHIFIRNACTHSTTHMRMHAHVCTHTLMQKYPMYTHIHDIATQAHTQAHTRTYAHKPMHTYTHVHNILSHIRTTTYGNTL